MRYISGVMNHAHETISTLRIVIDSRGLRYGWLATELGISPSHLGRLLDGERELSTEQGAVLARLTQLPVEEIREAARQSALATVRARLVELGVECNCGALRAAG